TLAGKLRATETLLNRSGRESAHCCVPIGIEDEVLVQPCDLKDLLRLQSELRQGKNAAVCPHAPLPVHQLGEADAVETARVGRSEEPDQLVAALFVDQPRDRGAQLPQPLLVQPQVAQADAKLVSLLLSLDLIEWTLHNGLQAWDRSDSILRR